MIPSNSHGSAQLEILLISTCVHQIYYIILKPFAAISLQHIACRFSPKFSTATMMWLIFFFTFGMYVVGLIAKIITLEELGKHKNVKNLFHLFHQEGDDEGDGKMLRLITSLDVRKYKCYLLAH